MYDVNFLKNNKINADKCISELGLNTYNELLHVFLKEIIDMVNNLNKSLCSNNMQDYSTYVHGIKGESLYLGFKDLASRALTHQEKSAAGDIEYIKKDYDNLINEICRIIKVLRIYLGSE